MGRRLALVVLIALAGCRGGGPAVADGVEAPRPQPGVDVRAVRAEIALDPETLGLEATAWLEVAHPDTLRTLVLGLDDALEVVTTRVGGAAVLAWREGDALVVPLEGGAGASTVEVAYRGTPAAGLYADEAAGQRVVYTDGWPDRTAGWLPAVHHPSDPARLDLTLDVPAGLEAVASGVLVAEDVVGPRRRARFVLEADAPTYTFAFAVGDFSVTEQGGPVPIRHALLAADAGLAPGLDRTPRILEALEALLGPYPYASYTTVEVPMAYAGMENAAAPFLRADLYRERAPGRNGVEEVNVHEAVHQWWGNAVVPADWRDLWLAEGAATYLTTEVYRRLDGADAGRSYRTLMSRSISPEDAGRPLVPASYGDPGEVLTPTVYQKGGAVFHLLHLALGEAAFVEALRRVQVEFADRPLATDDFRRVLEAASGRGLEALFDVWVYGGALPTLRVRWDEATRTLAWDVAGDAGTLDGVPFEVYVRQGAESWYVPATDGLFSPPGASRPTVEASGVLLTVEWE